MHWCKLFRAALAASASRRAGTYDTVRLVFDAYPPGFGVITYPTGRKALFYGARFRGSDNWRPWILGEWRPEDGERRLGLTLKEGRRRAEDAIEMLARGIDPRQQKRAEEQATRQQNAKRESETFGYLWELFLRESKGSVSHLGERTTAGQGFLARWSRRLVSDIEASEVRQHLISVRDSSGKSAADHHKSHLSAFFSWCIGNGLTKRNPVKDLSSKAMGLGSTRGARVLDDAELKAVWAAAGELGASTSGSGLFGVVTRLWLLTAKRHRELTDAEWVEIDWERRIWHIPGCRMKGGKAFDQPLTDEMIKLLNTVPRVGDCRFIFSLNGKAPIGGTGKWLVRLRARSGVQNWCPHDLRRTARTYWSGVPNITDTVKELGLAHSHKDVVRATYDLHTYAGELRSLFLAWERRLLSIVEPPEDGNVVPFAPVKPAA